MLDHDNPTETAPINPPLKALVGQFDSAINAQAWVFASVVWAFAVVLVALYGWDLPSTSSGEILGLDENVLQRTRGGGCRLPVRWSSR